MLFLQKNYLFSFFNLLIIFEQAYTISVDFLFAISFPIAFPPTVSAATIALITN